MSSQNYKTWINLKSSLADHNLKIFRSLIGPKVKLWAVVKSNAYGHGLLTFSKLVNELGVDGFCADSVIEGIKLRDSGIKKPILVLGPTLPNLLAEARRKNITITISNFDLLDRYLKSKEKPDFHLKIDTGMHRQGFYVSEIDKFLKKLRTSNSEPRTRLKGVYTHFASAKDINYTTFTDKQFLEFQKAIQLLEKSGFKNLIKHCAATGATLINNKYHLDAVRIGIGLYGLWPSMELEAQLGNKIKLQPALSWYSVVSEVKDLKKGDYVGYDLVERVIRPSKIAVIPIGYWHGFDRRLSGIGEVLINGRRARVLGRVSMDLIVVDVTGIKCKFGDRATLIGKQGKEEITLYEMARKIGTSHYEVVTRINPLIERTII